MHCPACLSQLAHILQCQYFIREYFTTQKGKINKKKDAPVDAVYVSDSSVEFYLSWHYWNKVDCQRLGRVLLSFVSIGIE